MEKIAGQVSLVDQAMQQAWSARGMGVQQHLRALRQS